MKILGFILVLGLLFSCSSDCCSKLTRCYVCEKEESIQVAEFISKNIKSANNMSDEEMEDVISELRDTGIKLYCKQKIVPCNSQGSIKWDEIQKDSLQTFHPYLY